MARKFWSGNTKAAKMTPTQVLNMRADYRDGMTQGQLARKYGLGIAQVGRIVRFEVWTDVKEELTEVDQSVMLARLLKVQEEVNSRATAADEEKRDREERSDRLLNEITEQPASTLPISESAVERMNRLIGKVKEKDKEADRLIDELKGDGNGTDAGKAG
jgi:hypothetical protein